MKDADSAFAAAWWSSGARRLDWAFRAHQRFLQGFSAEVKQHFLASENQQESFIAVFGKTQVGKTTLLLELMGLSGSSLREVSEVLRGRQGKAHSATATTMEYRCSPDNNWNLEGNGSSWKFHGNDEMADALREIRANMLEQNIRCDHPFVVGIPSRFFDAADRAAPRVRMLDLPGDQPANAVEQQHVRAMAEKYLPHADLILLVAKGDDLGFLKPENINLPVVKDWFIVPGRFRIVTTYSYTMESVRQAAMAQGVDVSADFLRCRLRDQIRTFGVQLSEEALRPALYFPLEFGESWMHAAKQQPELVKNLEPVRASLKQVLLEDLAASATPVARLFHAMEAHIVVSEVKKRKDKAFQTELSRLQELKMKRQNSFNSILGLIDVHEKRMCGIDCQIDAAAHFRTASAVAKMTAVDVEQYLSRIEELPHDRQDFIELIADFKSGLKQWFLAIASPRTDIGEVRNAVWKHASPSPLQFLHQIDDRLEVIFRELCEKLNSYMMDTYFPKFSKDYSKDQVALRTCMKKGAGAAVELAQRVWLDAVKKYWKTLEYEKDCIDSSIQDLHSSKKILGAEIRCITDDIDKLERRSLAFKRSIEVDDAHCRRFRSLLDEEYEMEITRRRDALTGMRAPQAFMSLLSIFNLMDARKEVSAKLRLTAC